MNPKVYKTERLLIKATDEEDAAFILALLNSPNWQKYIGGRNLHSKEQAKEYIKQKMLPQLKRLGFSNYTIIRKSDNAKIGICGLYDREGLDGIDIGFALFEEYEGNGFAYEASKKIVDLAINEFQIKKILAITTDANISSQKLLKKLGLKLIGPITLPNDEEEMLLYALDC